MKEKRIYHEDKTIKLLHCKISFGYKKAKDVEGKSKSFFKIIEIFFEINRFSYRDFINRFCILGLNHPWYIYTYLIQSYCFMINNWYLHFLNACLSASKYD